MKVLDHEHFLDRIKRLARESKPTPWGDAPHPDDPTPEDYRRRALRNHDPDDEDRDAR